MKLTWIGISKQVIHQFFPFKNLTTRIAHYDGIAGACYNHRMLVFAALAVKAPRTLPRAASAENELFSVRCASCLTEHGNAGVLDCFLEVDAVGGKLGERHLGAAAR